MTDRLTGIESLNVYGGVACVPVAELFAGRGLDTGRFGNLMMARRAVALPFEDPVTNAVNAAAPLLERLGEEERDSVEFLITATESGVDYSKSVASYVHEHLGLGRHCRLLEVKQACYSATAALRLAASYVASDVSPGARALVIATDVALADERAEYAEPATGSGAVAMLVGDDPRVLALDPGAFGLYSFETLDTARPSPAYDIADVDRSLLAYLECLRESFADYRARVEDVDLMTTFDLLALHTPFAGMVKAGHRKLLREFTAATPAEIEADFERRVGPSLTYPGEVGNLFSGSLYLALAAALDTARPAAPLRVGLFSYGSGCSSEFFSGVADQRSAEEVAAMDIAGRLSARAELTFAEYLEVLPENMRCLVPERDRKVDVAAYEHLLDRCADRRPMLALRAVEDHHRRYEWI
ncbi:hydroxymethylglutaryl-CoA synthase family protein [Microbispora hainanensis]|jgi:polyketide biosynthesis 3-hydroxy-3-methylglutaryl-CoA synthase-like enzyme PksG|uniref:Hydroxymethylglutaryl-CoA synthase family protein n=1 Tax=Microbispora hainanensis TaxID=568844 RepID=A0ABZ1SXW5_9ACTN|nr:MULTISPECIES: hydroxymethylglutaryl-CoA synthase [Microbispora]NJP26438.1 hydroxymethylglutaryl-CoA synthase family protein [Microbispora sp. CL1-1]TQS12252.1 hydroxymethylglutaryl-CoA synthase family protein [Microbispora sp. SCL1-1]